jgi:hypothetical protein
VSWPFIVAASPIRGGEMRATVTDGPYRVKEQSPSARERAPPVFVPDGMTSVVAFVADDDHEHPARRDRRLLRRADAEELPSQSRASGASGATRRDGEPACSSRSTWRQTSRRPPECADSAASRSAHRPRDVPVGRCANRAQVSPRAGLPHWRAGSGDCLGGSVSGLERSRDGTLPPPPFYFSRMRGCPPWHRFCSRP